MHRRSLIAIIMITALLVSFWPVAAHANIFTDAASSVLSGLLELVADMLDMVRGLLIEFISVLGTLLNAVISQPELSYGGAAVYTIWKLFRDICNILFIVMFIFISFGTIFNVLWKNPFHYSSALRGVLVAAIAINFSLAIGQTIVWAGNFATGMAVSLISGKNVGTQIAVALQLPQVIVGQQGQPVNTVPDEVTPLDQQNPIQRITSAGFTGAAKAAFENCQKYNQQPTVGGCSAVAARIQAIQNGAAIDSEISRLNESPSLKSRFQDAWTLWSSAAKGAVKGAAGGLTSVYPGGTFVGAVVGAMNGWGFGPQPKEAAKLSDSEYTQKILSLLLNVFLLLVLTLSFLTVIFFLVLRIPMIWLLLSFSSLAFFSSVWPGSGSLKKWFNNLVGWCIFSPLYMLVIYIGLFLLAQQNTLLAGMKNAAFISGSFGIILFYIMTAAIFIGGARYAMKYAFALSSSAGTLFGRIGGVLGVSEESRFGINTVAKYTGVSAYGGAAIDRAKQTGQDLTAAARGRFPALLRTEEEAKALARARFGVRGGEAKVAELQAGRVKTEQKIIEDAQKAQLQKLESARAVATSDVERANLDGKIKQLKNLQSATLRRDMLSGNRDAALASGELLMKTGKMTTAEMQQLGSKYQRLSPAALTEFVKRRDGQLMKDAEKRVYTKGNEAAEMAEALALFTDPKQAQKYIDAAGKGSNKFWALEAGTSRKLIMGPDGKTPVDLDYAVRERADQFNATNLVHAESYYNKKGPDTMPKELQDQYERSLLSPKRLAQMSITASSDLDQLARIHSRADVLRNEIPKLGIQVLDLTKKVKETRDDATKLAGQEQVEKLAEAEALQRELDTARERLSELKSPIKEPRTREEREEQKKQEGAGGVGESKKGPKKEEKKEE